MKVLNKMKTLISGVKRGTEKVRESALRLDVILQFAFVALCLWVIVENSSVAKTAFASIITSGLNNITSLFGSIGSL